MTRTWLTRTWLTGSRASPVGREKVFPPEFIEADVVDRRGQRGNRKCHWKDVEMGSSQQDSGCGNVWWLDPRSPAFSTREYYIQTHDGVANDQMRWHRDRVGMFGFM